MRSTEQRERRAGWILAALVVAAVFFAIALSDAVYEATSPSGLPFHVALRKAYSIVAFAILGFLADRALPATRRPLLRMTIVVALYSAAIEYGQWLHGSKEGLVWNAIDVVCGAIGGWLGAAASRRSARG